MPPDPAWGSSPLCSGSHLAGRHKASPEAAKSPEAGLGSARSSHRWESWCEDGAQPCGGRPSEPQHRRAEWEWVPAVVHLPGLLFWVGSAAFSYILYLRGRASAHPQLHQGPAPEASSLLTEGAQWSGSQEAMLKGPSSALNELLGIERGRWDGVGGRGHLPLPEKPVQRSNPAKEPFP